MKLLHTADWHIGRTLNGYSLLDEQEAAFKQILTIALAEKVDGIVIAGDIYDRAVPSTDAVTSLDHMLQAINIEHHLPIYAIAGNHDGAKRLNYGREWLAYNNFHINTLLAEAFTPIETPTAQIFMLPFLTPLTRGSTISNKVCPKNKSRRFTPFTMRCNAWLVTSLPPLILKNGTC